MNKTSATKLDLGQYALELADLQNAPPASIELPPLAAIAIISLVQLASRRPSVGGDDNLTKTAIDTARRFQELFHWESATYKVLESGWNSEEDRPLENCETWEDYIGEAPLDRYIDPEEERATYEDNYLYDEC